MVLGRLVFPVPPRCPQGKSKIRISLVKPPKRDLVLRTGWQRLLQLLNLLRILQDERVQVALAADLELGLCRLLVLLYAGS